MGSGVPSGPSAEDERETPQQLAQRWRRESAEHDNRMASDILLLCALELEGVLASRAPAGEPTVAPGTSFLSDSLNAAFGDGVKRTCDALRKHLDRLEQEHDYLPAGAAPDGRAPNEPPVLTKKLCDLIVRCEQEINAGLMGEATADPEMAWRELWTAIRGATP